MKNSRLKITLGIKSQFPSRNSEIIEIKKNFNKLFIYISNNQINKIDTKLFLKDFEEIVQEVECPICLQFPLNQIQCSQCLKIFCKECQTKEKCPICRNEFKAKELDRTLKNILDKLLLKCKKCEKYKRSTKIKTSDYINHLKSCDFSDYQCLFCKKIIQNSKQKCYEHAHFCGYSDSYCSYCKKSIKLFIKKEHEIKCGEEMIPCDFCNIKFERKKMENHQKNFCLMRIIKCDKCNENYKFIDTEKHLKDECKDNQIKYWKSKFEEAKQLLEEDFNFKYNEENIENLRRRTIERQNTEVNLFTNLNLDFQNTDRKKEKENELFKNFQDSSILKEKDYNYIYDLFIDEIPTKFNIVYKMTKDGENNFHIKCDNINSTLILMKIKKNNNAESYNRLGGYTSTNWDCSDKFKIDENAFIFSLTRKKVFRANSPYDSIYCSKSFGPCFGNKGSLPSFWTKGKYGEYNNSETFSDPGNDFTCGFKEFVIEEIEVYQVFFN